MLNQSPERKARGCLEVVAKPRSISTHLLEASVSTVFDKLEVYIEGKDIQAFHRYDRTIIKFSNRKENLHIVHVSEDLNFLDLTQLDFSEAMKIFFNDSLSLCLLSWSLE